MKKLFSIFILVIFSYTYLIGQDTTVVYIAIDEEQTTKEKAVYKRVAVKDGTGHWQTRDENLYDGLLRCTGMYKDDSLSIKEGAFTYYHDNGTKCREGVYKDNKYAGTWKVWHETGELQLEEYYDEEGLKTGAWKSLYEDGSIDYEGTYVKDSLHGEWKWYFNNGQMSAREVYDNGELKEIEFWDENGNQIKGELQPDIMPEFPGGLDELFKFLGNEIVYPPKARKKDIEGKVYVRFTVYEDGSLGDFKLANSAHPLLDEEALRVTKKMPKWIPGKKHNRKVRIAYTLPFLFRLENRFGKIK